MFNPPEKKCKEENRVIIRIWTSEYNKKHPGENVGHVSIETTIPPSYMSLWPKGQPNEDFMKAVFEKRSSHYMASYNDDFIAEKRAPEITICLYTLNVEKIIDKFNEIKKENENWTLLGNTLLINRGTSHSCATLGYELLKAGEIFDIITSGYSSSYCLIVAPDTLVPAIKEAKKQELKKHPESCGFLFDNEFSIPVEEKSNSSCSIL